MIAYLDTSVLIRVLLRERNPLREWDEIQVGVTSRITRVECCRTLDRLRLAGVLDEEEYSAKVAEADDLLSRLDIVKLTRKVILRAAEPLPTVVRTLDAIHLISAMTYREKQKEDEPPILMATHDHALAEAARATGFRVLF